MLAEEGDLTKLSGQTGKYIKILSGAIAHPWKVILSIVAISAIVIFSYGASSGLSVVFFPDIEPSSATMVVRFYGGLSIREKDEIMVAIENRILDLEGIETLYTRTGGNDLLSTFQVYFSDWQFRKIADEIVKDIHLRTEDLVSVGIEVCKNENGPQSGKDLRLELSSRFPEEKRNIGRLDSLRLKTASGLVPVSSFVERKAAPKIDTIRRIDSKHVVTTQANLKPGA